MGKENNFFKKNKDTVNELKDIKSDESVKIEYSDRKFSQKKEGTLRQYIKQEANEVYEELHNLYLYNEDHDIEEECSDSDEDNLINELKI